MAEPDDPRVNKFVPWVCIALFAANVAMFGVELAKGADLLWGPKPLDMLHIGGNLGPVTLDGEQWRLFTSMFLHYGILHLAANMLLGLYQVGRGTEQAFGHARFAVLYVVSGLGGSLASAIRGHAISAGASGAIFGLVGGFLAFLVVNRKRLDPDALRKQLTNLAYVIAINVWLGFQAAGIDQAAHLGGLGSGFLVGLALEAGINMKPGANRLVRAAIVGALGVGAIVGASIAVGKPTNMRVAFEPGVVDFAKAETHVLDSFQGLASSRPTNEALAAGIDRILTEWEAAQIAYIDAGGSNQKLLTYINARRDAWIELRDGLRANDQAKVDHGWRMFEHANSLAAQVQ